MREKHSISVHVFLHSVAITMHVFGVLFQDSKIRNLKTSWPVMTHSKDIESLRSELCFLLQLQTEGLAYFANPYRPQAPVSLSK